MKNNLKVIIGYVLAIVVIVGVIAMIYRSTSSKTEVITYDKVVAYFQKEEVREFEIDNKNNLTMLLYQYKLDENGQFTIEDFETNKKQLYNGLYNG